MHFKPPKYHTNYIHQCLHSQYQLIAASVSRRPILERRPVSTYHGSDTGLSTRHRYQCYQFCSWLKCLSFSFQYAVRSSQLVGNVKDPAMPIRCRRGAPHLPPHSCGHWRQLPRLITPQKMPQLSGMPKFELILQRAIEKCDTIR